MGNKTEDKTMRQDILRAKTRPVEFHWDGGWVKSSTCVLLKVIPLVLEGLKSGAVGGSAIPHSCGAIKSGKWASERQTDRINRVQLKNVL